MKELRRFTEGIFDGPVAIGDVMLDELKSVIGSDVTIKDIVIEDDTLRFIGNSKLTNSKKTLQPFIMKDNGVKTLDDALKDILDNNENIETIEFYGFPNRISLTVPYTTSMFEYKNVDVSCSLDIESVGNRFMDLSESYIRYGGPKKKSIIDALWLKIYINNGCAGLDITGVEIDGFDVLYIRSYIEQFTKTEISPSVLDNLKKVIIDYESRATYNRVSELIELIEENGNKPLTMESDEVEFHSGIMGLSDTNNHKIVVELLDTAVDTDKRIKFAKINRNKWKCYV